MAGGDVAPGEQQVRRVHRVEAAVRDVVDPVRVPLLRPVLGGVHPLRRVQVDGPAAERHPVGELALAEDVALVEDVVAEEAPVLALAGHRAHPFQRHGVRVELAGVLDVVPDAVDDRPQLVADALVVVHRVELAAELDPPVGAAVVTGLDDAALRNGGLGDVPGEVGRHELYGAPGVLGVEEQGRAEREGVGGLRRPRLLVLGPGLPADAVPGTGEMTDESVSRTVQEHVALEADPPLRSHHPAGDGGDAPGVLGALGVHLAHIGVEVERDARLGADRVQHHGVPVVRVAVGVAELVLDEEFAHDAALAGVVVPAVPGRAAHPDADLAARIAAEDGPVVDEGDGAAQPGGGDGRTDPGQAAADDCDVVPCGFVPHDSAVPTSSRGWRRGRRRCAARRRG